MKALFVTAMILVGLVAHPLQNPNDAPHVTVPSGMLVLAGRIDYVPSPILSAAVSANEFARASNSNAVLSDAEERLSLAMEALRYHDPAFFKGIMNFYAISLRERAK